MSEYCIIEDIVEKIKKKYTIDGFNDMVKVDIEIKKGIYRKNKGITIFKEDIFESQLEAYMFLRDGLIADLEYVNKKIDSLEEKE